MQYVTATLGARSWMRNQLDKLKFQGHLADYHEDKGFESVFWLKGLTASGQVYLKTLTN